MNSAGKFFSIFLSFVLFIVSCQDKTSIVDSNTIINNRSWAYVNKIQVKAEIPDQKIPYNVFVNLRHSADYKYSNLFLLIRMKGPDGKVITERKEFKLALPDGEWLGKGSGNLYSYQLPFKQQFYFSQKGNYTLEIEQNMRNNPLREITDVGIRIERAE
ncbi:gliding motility lipoprotein GldH [Daejeonella oryzae]|uniref:gliding motility lipoprotein GldH n=1 Tax=Daejeonella oryzae TaxID=1122943 RepID=UPI000416CB89|nr:gliding motility lipoprotein GldH [Daejeonella oryzae]